MPRRTGCWRSSAGIEKESKEIKLATRRGGKRPGAGRPRGALNKATADIKRIAQDHGGEAIRVLATIMSEAGEPAAARVAAARELLDRGYGRVPQAIGGTNELPPIKSTRVFNYSVLSEAALSELMAAADAAATEPD